MPRVPYSGVPDRHPQFDATPSFSVNTPEAAFGGATAKATSQLGNQIQHSSDELWGAAVKVQNLQNETEASELIADHMVGSSDLREKYTTLEGNNAVNGYEGYVKSQQDYRADVRKRASNDAVRRMFDHSSLQTTGRNVTSGTTYAAGQQKVAAHKAANAEVAGLVNDAATNSQDDVDFENRLGEAVNKNTQFLIEQKGAGKVDIDHQTAELVSAAWAQRAIHEAKSNPYSAKDMYERHKDKVLSQDREKVEDRIKSGMHQVTSRNVSDAVNQGYAPYMKQSDIEKFKGVDDTLTRVFKRAQKDNPDLQLVPASEFAGRRDQATQDKLVAQGHSKTRDSNHLYGRAIDIGALGPNGKIAEDWPTQQKVEKAMRDAFEAEGIPLGGEHDKIRHWDPGHFSLPRDYDVSTAPKPKPESLESRKAAAVDYAQKIAKDDPVMRDAVESRVTTDFNRQKADKRDAEYTDRNTVVGALTGAFQGKVPVTVEEMIGLDPKVKEAWERLDNVHQQPYIKQLAHNAKGDKIDWTTERLSKYQGIKGLAISDPNEFLGLNVLDTDLPNAAKRELINQQLSMMKKSDDDPRVMQAVSVLGPELNAAGIIKSKDPDRYHQFVGALQDALSDQQKDTKKKATVEDIRKIGSRLLADQTKNWIFSNTKLFEMPVPDDKAKIISEEFKGITGVEATEEQVKRIYARSLYKNLYGKKDAEASKPNLRGAVAP